MTPHEKAVATIGHQESCSHHDGGVFTQGPPPCTCDFPLHVLIAAERGRLRKEHKWSRKRNRYGELECPVCGERCPEAFHGHHPPCAEPLTPALAWELLVEGKISLAWGSDSGMWVASHEHETADGVDYFEELDEDPIEAVARLRLALRRDDVE